MATTVEQHAVTEEQQATGAAEEVHRRVYVLVDDTASSHSMWKWARENEIRNGDQVTLVTLVRVAATQMPYAEGDASAKLPDKDKQAVDSAKAKAQEALNKMKEEASPEGWTIDTLLAYSKSYVSTGEALVGFLKTQKDVDEAIIGSRDMGRFKKVMMTLVGQGSVGDYVTHHAPCPVLVHHPKKDTVAHVGRKDAPPAGN